MRRDVIWGVCGLALALGLICGAGPAFGRSGRQFKTVRYRGYTVRVPSAWPVYDLARHPGTCVRFDRHAVYVGVPGPRQDCPAHAAGHTSAILLEPVGAAAARADSGRVRVITTAAGTRSEGGAVAHRASVPLAHTASVYTGLGFDVCDTPSTRTMSAWSSSSPYRAVGVYIGGVNAACSQGNLNRSWVATEAAAGWHLIPIYVGLQAPSNSCRCSGISPSNASAQGTAAADDAVTQAQALGIPSGNPVYYDMEGYPTGGTNTSAVLTFLSAWTTELHAKRYVSGVYSSASSGVSDLASRYGTGYPEPDDLWIANWNGQKSTSDPYVPSSDWNNHRRLHQYSGDQNETYGGVTLNIDGDYLDGATAGTSAGGAGGQPPPPRPRVSVKSAADGTTSIDASWSGGRGLRAWRVLAGVTQSSLSPVAGATAHGSHTVVRVPNGSPYFAAQALGSSRQVLATSATVAAPAHLAVFGHSAFVSQSGTGGIPAGCYAHRTCHIATTISVGRTVIARTGTESIPNPGAGIVYFTLTTTGQFLLANAPAGQLRVRVSLRDTSGAKATVPLTLIGFSTGGHTLPKRLRQAPPVRILGATDFVPARGMGGILAACSSPTPCHIAATVSVGGTMVAKTGPETIGGEEAGYVFFSVSGSGRRLLANAADNQLEANVVLAAGASIARGTIALVRFS